MNPLNQDNFSRGMLSGVDCFIHFYKLVSMSVPMFGFIHLYKQYLGSNFAQIRPTRGVYGAYLCHCFLKLSFTQREVELANLL